MIIVRRQDARQRKTKTRCQIQVNLVLLLANILAWFHCFALFIKHKSEGEIFAHVLCLLTLLQLSLESCYVM